jgi:negative regulator of sigma E activity
MAQLHSKRWALVFSDSAYLKSTGRTSETNQGIAFGLSVSPGEDHERKTTHWKTTSLTKGVQDTKKSARMKSV